MAIEGTCPRIYDISDMKNIDFRRIDAKDATDYELYQIKTLYSDIRQRMIDLLIERFDKSFNIFRDALDKFDNYGQKNIFEKELSKRMDYVRRSIYQKEGFGKIPNYVPVDEDIYYHVTNPEVLKTGIDLSKGRVGKIKDIFSDNEYCIQVTPGFVYLFKSSRGGLRSAIDAALISGKIVVKVVIPRDLVVLDADQVRFVRGEYEFKDSEALRELSWNDAVRYINEHQEVKEKLERWSYRATPFRVDKDQILGVIYNPNLITKYPEEILTARDVAYISFKFGERVFTDAHREARISHENIIALLSLSDQIQEGKISDIYAAVNQIFPLKEYKDTFMDVEGYQLDREEFAKGFALRSMMFRRYIHD